MKRWTQKPYPYWQWVVLQRGGLLTVQSLPQQHK